MAAPRNQLWRLLPALLFLCPALLCRSALCQTVQIAHDDALRDNSWETLAITAQIPAAASDTSITVQDARGGPSITRTVHGTNQRHVLFPLPVVDVTALPPAQWPIRVTIRGANMPEQTTVVEAERRDVASPTGTIRLAVCSDVNPDPALTAALSPAPVVLMHVSEDELLSDPPLVFACCDAIWIDQHVAARMSSNRATELIAAGPNLLYAGPAAPGGLLAELFWEPANPQFTLWQVPTARLPALRPVDPLLRKLPSITPDVPPKLTRAGLAIMPVCIGLILLIRVFTAKPAILLISAAGLSIASMAGAIGMMRATLSPQQNVMSWSTRQAPGSLAFTQTYRTTTALLGDTVELKQAPLPIMPTTPDNADWFRLANTSIMLDGSSCHTKSALPPRRLRYFVTRGIAITPRLDPPPHDEQALTAWGRHALGVPWDMGGFRIEGGNVVPESDLHASAMTFPQWVDEASEDVKPTLRAWYELSFKQDHVYHIGLPETGQPDIAVIDLCSRLPQQIRNFQDRISRLFRFFPPAALPGKIAA